MLPETKKKLSIVIALFLYFSNSNFKVGESARFLGGTGGKIRLNVENGHFTRA